MIGLRHGLLRSSLGLSSMRPMRTCGIGSPRVHSERRTRMRCLRVWGRVLYWHRRHILSGISRAEFRPGPVPSPNVVLLAAMHDMRPVVRERLEGPNRQRVTKIFDRCRDAVNVAGVDKLIGQACVWPVLSAFTSAWQSRSRRIAISCEMSLSG